MRPQTLLSSTQEQESTEVWTVVWRLPDLTVGPKSGFSTNFPRLKSRIGF